MTDLVTKGKVRYIGSSSFRATSTRAMAAVSASTGGPMATVAANDVAPHASRPTVPALALASQMDGRPSS